MHLLYSWFSFGRLQTLDWLYGDGGNWSPTGQPDRLHFHQLAMRFLEIRFGRQQRQFVNPLSTIILAPLISVPQVLGVLFWNNFLATVLLTGFMALIFILTYFIGITMAKARRLSNG